MVDRFVPWRLVADIGSADMLEYATAYGTPSTNSILFQGYDYTHLRYYNKFKFWLLQLYNQVKLPIFTINEDCRGATISTSFIPETYSKETLVAKYSEGYFLNVYCRIRFMEEESKFADHERENLIDDTMELYQAKGVAVALNKFEKIINKPFDYRGSMSYNRIYQLARKNAEEP